MRLCTVLQVLCTGLVFWIAGTLSGVGRDATPKRVLLLYHSFAINLIHAREIRAQLDRQPQDFIEIYDAPLLPPSDENVEDRYAEYLYARFRDQRLDLAIAIGADAMTLFRRYRDHAFPSTPMLALLDERRIPLSNLTANEAAVGSSTNLPSFWRISCRCFRTLQLPQQ
jgi:hypothetical protein